MNYSLSNMLGRRMALASLDPDAKGYIDAVVAAGGTVSGGQKSAINTFVKTGKNAGWYSSLKRLYLPIWGVAAPNAICMTSLTSGTFVGTVTQGAGFVQGDNTTGYFNTSTALHSVGLNGKQAMQGVLSLEDLSGSDNIGCLVATSRMLLSNAIGQMTSQMVLNTQQAVFAGDFTGVIIASRTSATSHRIYRRNNASGFTSGTENTTLESLNLPNVAPFFAGAANNNATPLRGTATGKQGAYFFGDGLTSAQATAYSLALKNLWEGTTGLTLP
jgi:hypothetical protein